MSQAFKGKFSTIKEGFSSNRRIPRLGKIRLGIKKVAANGKEYPSEVDYFVCPDEVKLVYGPHPTELDVMLMSEDSEIIFPQKLARYGSSKGLVCHGDGVNAERLNPQTKAWEPRGCPCEFRKTQENPKGDCTETANLMVLLPKVNMGGCYQLTTGSYNSTVDINSGIEYIRALIGRIAMVPLKLRRQATQTHHDGKKQTHYTLTLTLDADVEGINKLREDNSRVLSSAKFQIEGPVETNPAYDDPDVIEVESQDVEIESQPATIDAEVSAQPKPQQRSEEATVAIPLTPSWGPEPKKPITQVSDDNLLTYAEGLQKALSIEDDQEILETDDVKVVEKKQKFNAAQAKKRKFQKQNQALYDAMVEELRRREAKAANTEEPAADGQG